ncbi:C6 transcription factor, putative [Talaromyces stipitatus ATCC 10500]|uniref:C6 transcription factor, putative n=1 Tax=Talaromyces stipitatus (strain ATCC 10500 / CBS 375.48 / QM 6759 / NRRL 1006) TaxID=441959 RepID=B8MMX4_TALSN|nr:C6 transcription factor, putative [Talaromyces stipitatus ATCC 10500]EED13923.1 C6 transcription factor, putative [Talaromyces stipitatus ATCC 10500]
MTSYGGPSILNPDFRRTLSGVGVGVGAIPMVTPPVPDASALRTTAARSNGPVLGSILSAPGPGPGTGAIQGLEGDKSQPIKKRRGGNRRACNECKQQKLRCDIVQAPASGRSPCSRCKRLNIDCKVEQSFKRISKRRRNAEMEREIADLRRRLAAGERPEGQVDAGDGREVNHSSGEVYYDAQSPPSSSRAQSLSVSVEHQPSPLRRSLVPTESPIPPSANAWVLEDISLSKKRVDRLFDQYFKFYHPFLPLLDPSKDPEEIRSCSDILAWTVICVSSRRCPYESGLLVSLSGPFSRLLWASISSVPQNYHVVKALCLLCTWPLPTTSQKSDQTFMLSGLMMNLAMQLGLHRPVQPEEFTTFRMEVRGEELKDRLQTWVLCNLVAQNVATGYGQPPSTIYDWALEPASLRAADYKLPEELKVRLRIEKFCDRVTRSLYNGRPEPSEFLSMDKLLLVGILENELKEMELDFGDDLSQINLIHLRAANLHLRYFVFLSQNARSEDLTNLFLATTSFLGRVLELETSPGNLLIHATNYILQMIVSAAFALMKLLKSSFARQIDIDHGKFLFNGAISSIRRISVVDNDRPVRLANVISQMWNAGSSGDDALHLGIRSRMSMSHVYDTVWRWRRRFKQQKASDEAQVGSVAQTATAAGVTGPQSENALNNASWILPANFEDSTFMNEASFSDFFDSLNWVFDGVPDSIIAPPVL